MWLFEFEHEENIHSNPMCSMIETSICIHTMFTRDTQICILGIMFVTIEFKEYCFPKGVTTPGHDCPNHITWNGVLMGVSSNLTVNIMEVETIFFYFQKSKMISVISSNFSQFSFVIKMSYLFVLPVWYLQNTQLSAAFPGQS